MKQHIETNRHRNMVFGTMALALLMMSIDTTIIATALHAIREGLQTSINLASWSITAYSFGFILSLPLAGKLAERYGRRIVFLVSTVVFTLTSLGCALSNEIYWLIVLRVLQAAGGAGFMPSATGIIVEHFGLGRDRYVSLFGSIFPIGAMVGPVLGGYLVTYSSWRSIFYINVPLGALILCLSLYFLPQDDLKPDKPSVRNLDILGIVLLASALLAFMVAAAIYANAPILDSSLYAGCLLLLGVALLAGFFLHINSIESPFIPPHLILGRGFAAVNLVNLIYSGFTVGMMTLLPLYAISRYGIDAAQAGMLLAAQAGATLFWSLVGLLLLRRTGYRLPLYVGNSLAVVGFLFVAVPPGAGVAPMLWLTSAAILVGTGNGVINPATRNAGLQMEPESSSMIAALRALSMQLGSLIIISAVTAGISRMGDPALTLAAVYALLAVLQLLGLALVGHVPEQRGAW